MIRAWRIVGEARAAEAVTGEGARQFGGRWNSPGVAVIYASEHQSLAALELLVHLQPRGSLRFAAFAVEFDEELIEIVPVASLPPQWRAEPPGAATMEIGDAWARKARAAVLAVPSVVIPQGNNYLLNPIHFAFGRIQVQRPLEFTCNTMLADLSQL